VRQLQNRELAYFRACVRRSSKAAMTLWLSCLSDPYRKDPSLSSGIDRQALFVLITRAEASERPVTACGRLQRL